MNKEVFLKAISELQSGDKKDGSGKWYARDIVLEVNDKTLYRDTFVVRYTGEKAVECKLEVGKRYHAEISFSVRSTGNRTWQDMWLKRLEIVEETPQEEEPF